MGKVIANQSEEWFVRGGWSVASAPRLRIARGMGVEQQILIDVQNFSRLFSAICPATDYLQHLGVRSVEKIELEEAG